MLPRADWVFTVLTYMASQGWTYTSTSSRASTSVPISAAAGVGEVSLATVARAFSLGMLLAPSPARDVVQARLILVRQRQANS